MADEALKAFDRSSLGQWIILPVRTLIALMEVHLSPTDDNTTSRHTDKL